VMEYIEGKTAGRLIAEQGSVPVATAVSLVRQVALGLEHVHRKGLIHRDVNPENILVTHDGIAKLADLGLAIDLDEADRVTRDESTVGTFDYLAPEQARDSHAADIRSDIYSLGCTLYHLISGQVPFPIPSLPEELLTHRTMDPTPLNQFVPGLSEGLVEVVARMMRQSPDERYATPLLVAQALTPFEIASNCFETSNADESQAPLATPVNGAGLSEQLSHAGSRSANGFSTTAGSATTTHTPVPEAGLSTSNDSARVPEWLPIWFWGLVALMVLMMASALIHISGG